MVRPEKERKRVQIQFKDVRDSKKSKSITVYDLTVDEAYAKIDAQFVNNRKESKNGL